jgi:2-methylcitrate dehydratase PrpD
MAQDQNLYSSVTQTLAGYVAEAEPDALPDAVRKEAARTFLNWLGCAVGGAHHKTMDIAVAALAPFSGPAQASILGRSEMFDILHAALLNGISSHIFDFDDTHLRTVIHPAGPVASALLAYGEYSSVSGRDFVNALVLGIEVECRIGNSVYPEHYDVGWHITGTTGVFGAAAAVGKLMGLDTEHMSWAFGLAATQPVGLREMFGTMTKSFHPGRAAQNGMTAALLAAKGYTSSQQGIDAKRGWANVLSSAHNYTEITEGLGETYEILKNSYKPFACGIVIHPTIDGCVQVREKEKISADQIESVALSVHPLVLELTGKTAPQTGLEGKFSVYHAAAAALIEGDGGENQFSDSAVQDQNIIALRKRITAVLDPSIASDEARISVKLRDGRVFDLHVPHAIGSVARPMSNADLEHKFRGLTTGIIGEDKSTQLIDLCWQLGKLETVADIARVARG